MITRTVEWLNANRYRRYPFVDDAPLTLTSEAGEAVLANDVLLDFQAVATSPDYIAGDFALAQVQALAGSTAVMFVFDVGNKEVSITVPAAAAFPYTVQGLHDGIRYAACFGAGCTALLAEALTEYAVAGAALQPALLAEQTRHRLDSVAGTTAGRGNSAVLTGAVYVEAGYNCDPVVTQAKIRLTAGRGWGAGRYCAPLANNVISCREALLRINGQVASEDGNVGLSGVGLSIEPHPNTGLYPNTVLVKIASSFYDNMKCG